MNSYCYWGGGGGLIQVPPGNTSTPANTSTPRVFRFKLIYILVCSGVSENTNFHQSSPIFTSFHNIIFGHFFVKNCEEL